MSILSRIPVSLLIPSALLVSLAFTRGDSGEPPPAERAALEWRTLHEHRGEPRGPGGLGVVLRDATSDGTRLFAVAPMQSLFSPDGGSSWQDLPGLRAAYAVRTGPGGLVLIARHGGGISRSEDGGRTWAEVQTPSDLQLSALHVTTHRVFAGGVNYLFRSEDRGLTWTRIPAPDVHYYDIDSSEETVIAVGGAGVVARSLDGGATWTTQWLPGDETLSGVAVVDPTTAVIVGSGGIVLRTTDAGATWTEVENPARTHLRAVDFDGAHGLAVGLWGEAIRSTDGGASWERERTGTRMHLMSVESDPGGAFVVSGIRELVLSAAAGGAR